VQRSKPPWRRNGVATAPDVVTSDVVASGDADPGSLTESAPDDFDAWVVANGSDLLRFAYLVLGDRHRAEEAVQEALVRACGRWRRVSAADDPRAYVRRMVINADISWWRKVGRREHPVAEIFDRPGVATSLAADPGATVTEVDAMWRLCANLPRGQRAAVVLRYYEGLPDAEIAAILGCAEGTVRSQIHRALASLRVHLAEQERHHA
jgi:RNA polymerase sigma-70 factor (sigma-E family)